MDETQEDRRKRLRAVASDVARQAGEGRFQLAAAYKSSSTLTHVAAAGRAEAPVGPQPSGLPAPFAAGPAHSSGALVFPRSVAA